MFFQAQLFSFIYTCLLPPDPWGCKGNDKWCCQTIAVPFCFLFLILFPSSSVDFPHRLKPFRNKLLLGEFLDSSFGSYPLGTYMVLSTGCTVNICPSVVLSTGCRETAAPPWSPEGGSRGILDLASGFFSQLGSSHHFSQCLCSTLLFLQCCPLDAIVAADMAASSSSFLFPVTC